MLFVKEPKKIEPKVMDLSRVGVPDEEYTTLATKLRMTSRSQPPDPTPLARFLKENLIHIYPFAQVDRYMRKMASKQGSNIRYCWRPMRNEDYEISSFSMVAGEDFKRYSVNLNLSTYDKPIPFPVLKTVEEVYDRFGSQANFFVTDYETKPVEWPDPFLAVKHKQSGEFYVIEKWDEPTFREAK